MNDSLLISVIIPTYNEAETIAVAIQSMIDQTYKNLEIIVVDDGSTDNTRDIVLEFAKNDPRVRYIKCPFTDPNRTDWRGVNISVGWLARNYAMKESRGEWITFQDADDASLLNRIETQYNLAVRYNATFITTSWLPLKKEYMRKSLDVARIFKEEKNLVMEPGAITKVAEETRGVLMTGWFPYQYIPFTVKKWFPFARKLFFGTQEKYPGADNSMFFNRSVIRKAKFRKLSERQWSALSGRGVGRDFAFQAAILFKNSYSFRLPLYLWHTKDTHNPYPGWEKYLIS